MRSIFGGVGIAILATSSAVAVAQQTSPIRPNYTRPTSRADRYTGLLTPNRTVNASGPEISFLSNGRPTSTTIGTGLQRATGTGQAVIIEQQGTVEMSPATVGPAYGHSGAIVCGDGPCTSACSDGSCATPSGCTSCGGHGCLGSCQVGKGLHCLSQWLHANKNCRGYFGGLYYLNLWRDDDNAGLPLASSVADPATPLVSIGNARMKDASGLGIRVGKMINPCWAVEGIYWQALPDDGFAELQSSVIGSNLNSRTLFTDLTYDNLGGGGPVPVNDFFQDSQYISLRRTYDYKNFELNFLRLPYVYGGNNCGKARLALLGGVRYFRADESFEFFSDDLNEIRGDDPDNELHYLNEVENYLVGFQLGGLLDYCVTSRLSAQIGSKFGIYNNHQKQRLGVAGGVGGAIIGGVGPDAGQPFALESKKDDVAFLAELDAGLAYCVNQNWRLTGGYKVLAVSSYVDSANQLPYHFNSLSSTGLLQDNNSLILHGIYAGVEYAW